MTKISRKLAATSQLKENKHIADLNYQLTGIDAEEVKGLSEYARDIREYYESLIAAMPGHVYWMDRNNVFLGCNDQQAKSAGLSSRHEIVGKTNYEMPWKDYAEALHRTKNS